MGAAHRRNDAGGRTNTGPAVIPRLAIVLAMAACGGERSAPPDPTPPPRQKPTAPTSDIVVSSTKTSAGGVVLELGTPRFQTTPDPGLGFEVRLAADRAFVADRDEAKIFELAHGTLIARWNPSAFTCDDMIASLRVSSDGRWVATCGELLESPFHTVTPGVDYSYLAGFSVDSKLAIVAHDDVKLIDLATKKIVTTLPAPPIADQTLAITYDGARATWIRSKDVLVAASGATSWTVLMKSPLPWKTVELARGGTAAAATTATSLERLDLKSATTKVIAPASPIFAISPDGDRIAYSAGTELRVVRGTGDRIATIPKAERVGRVTFADDNVLAYLDDQTLRLHDLAKGPRAIESPSRFHSWGSDSAAIIARGTYLEQLAIATRATSPATAPIAPVVAGAPPWATSVTTAPDGSVIASDLVLHDTPIWRRAKFECEPKLRVWTPKGGERAFTLVPTDDDDPCWHIEGSRVIAATTKSIAIYNPVTGHKLASLDVGAPPLPAADRAKHPALAQHYWMAAVSPRGTHLALWWRRADVFAPQKSDLPDADELETSCRRDRSYSCVPEYFAEVWSLEPKPQRLWQSRLDARPPVVSTRGWPESKLASSPIAFTHDGKHVLFGFDDGDIVIRAIDAATAMRVESLHRAPVSRIEVSPNDSYVFSEDTEGAQRIWPLARP